MSLRLKIILAFILCILLTLSPLIYILQTQVKIANMDHFENQVSQLIDSKSNEIGSWLNQRISEIKIMLEYPSIENLNFSELKPQLTKINKSLQSQGRSANETFAIGGLDGKAWISNSISIDVSDREYFKNLLNTKDEYIISDPIISKSDNMPIFLISHPIKDDMNNKIGFINGSVSLEKVATIANDIDIYNGFSWIMNKKSDVYSIDKEKLTRSYLSPDGLNEIINESNGNSSYILKVKNLSGNYTRVFVSSIPYTKDWLLCTMIEDNQIYGQTNNIINLIVRLGLFFLLVAILFSIIISGSIVKPIQKLKYNMLEVSSGNLDSYYSVENKDEISILGNAFNKMLDDIKGLIDQVYIIENQKRNAELKSLQSQINPHFLYNTLDTAQWKALEYNAFEVADIINLLSGFFRLSLSDGKEFITIDDELQHVANYLEIQKIRYKEKVNYTINMDESLKPYLIPKLILQPLVENSIYHGLKLKKQKGFINIDIYSKNEYLLIKVEDNGLGIDPGKLKLLRENLDNSIESEHYGLYNINERLKLTFKDKYEITIESKFEIGTKVLIQIPLISEGFECFEC